VLKNKDFKIQNKKIYFGLTNIKGVGQSVFDKLYGIIADIDLIKYTWSETLFYILLNINSTAAKALIQSGALDYLKVSRNQMLYEFNLVCELTKKETENTIKLIKDNPKLQIIELIRQLIANTKISKNRQQKVLSIVNQLSEPPYSLVDSPEWISDNERELLGAPITCTKTDSYDSSYANTDCKDIRNFPDTKQFFIIAEIQSVNIIVTKRGRSPGKEMCFIQISDSYGSLDCVLFPEEFAENKALLQAGRVLMFNGQKSKKDSSVIIKKIFVV
jgi:DNA polymerase III alpha subunit